MGTFHRKVYVKYGHFGCFWEVLFFPFLVINHQMCLMGSITSTNRGGGSDPLLKNSIINPLFLGWLPLLSFAQISSLLGLLCQLGSLEEGMRGNIAKIRGRKERGTLRGDGSDR